MSVAPPQVGIPLSDLSMDASYTHVSPVNQAAPSPSNAPFTATLFKGAKSSINYFKSALMGIMEKIVALVENIFNFLKVKCSQNFNLNKLFYKASPPSYNVSPPSSPPIKQAVSPSQEISAKEKALMREILTVLASGNLLRAKNLKNTLPEKRKGMIPSHPLRLIQEVLVDPSLRQLLHQVYANRKSMFFSWTWGVLLDEFTNNLSYLQESSLKSPILSELASLCDVEIESLKKLIQEDKWNEFIILLVEKSKSFVASSPE